MVITIETAPAAKMRQEGGLYRSAQLSENELQMAIRHHEIRAILNLRGAHPGQSWYDDEIAVSKALGVAHYDYALSAYRVVTDNQITELLGIIRHAPKPLLVHCKSGADRTGLVSALYRFAIEGKSVNFSRPSHEPDFPRSVRTFRICTTAGVPCCAGCAAPRTLGPESGPRSSRSR
jgi:protein tyrosine/serine phosphatase